MSAIKKMHMSVLFGNMLEFYDLGLYGFLGYIITPLFFPLHDPAAKLIASGGLFAAGFVMRPLGGIIFGYIGDIWDRKTCLTLSLLLMTIPSLIIGILPTYEEIGISAAVILTACRLLQGICTGGEYNNAAILILEDTPLDKQGTYSGFITASAILGFFLASLVTAVCFHLFDFASSYIWRLPFFLGSIIGLVGFYIRRQLAYSPPSVRQSFKKVNYFSYLKPFTLVFAVGWFAGVLSLSLIGYIPAYLSKVSTLQFAKIALLNNLGLVVYLMSLIAGGIMADRVGIAKVMKTSAFLTILLSYPLFFLLTTNNLGMITAGILMLAILSGLFLSPMHAYMLQLFPPQFRCRGVSIGFSLGIAILGGTAPLISEYLIQILKFSEAPFLYFCFSSLVVFGLMTKYKVTALPQ